MKKRLISTMIAAICAMSPVSAIPAQAETPGVQSVGDYTGYKQNFIVYDTSDGILMHEITTGYRDAAPAGHYLYAPPAKFASGFLENYYEGDPADIQVGDVLVIDPPVSVLDSPVLEVVDWDMTDPVTVKNLGHYETIFGARELTVTAFADRVYTFTDEDGAVFTSDKYFPYWNDACPIPELAVGAAVKAFIYQDIALPIEVYAATPLPAGDPDEDGAVNSKDASAVLRTASQIGAKNKPTLNLAQRNACDVNGDGVVNANDAADILRYAAYIGARNPYRSIQDFLAK